MFCADCREPILGQAEWDEGKPVHPSCKVYRDLERGEVRRYFEARRKRGAGPGMAPLYFGGGKKSSRQDAMAPRR